MKGSSHVAFEYAETLQVLVLVEAELRDRDPKIDLPKEFTF